MATEVRYKLGTTLIGIGTVAPDYAFNWTNAPLGSHAITAEFYVDNVKVASSGVINVAVIEGGAFSPAQLANGIYWYDATDLSTITKSGTSVTAFNSKIGSKQLTSASNHPTYVDAESAINFSAKNQILANATPFSQLGKNQDFHGFFVFRLNEAVDNTLMHNTINSDNRFAISRRSGKLGVGFYQGSVDGYKTVNFTSVGATTEFKILEFKSKAGVVTGFLDGAAPASSNDSMYTIADVGVSLRAGEAGAADGKATIREAFAVSGEMSAAERTNALNYLIAKHQ